MSYSRHRAINERSKVIRAKIIELKEEARLLLAKDDEGRY